MYKISKTKVSTGIYKKAKGVYLFSLVKGSSKTLYLRKQKQVKAVNDKQARALFGVWLERELRNYDKNLAKLEQADALGTAGITFAHYTYQGATPADDAQFFMQLKAEATSDKTAGVHRQVTNLQTVKSMRSSFNVLNQYTSFSHTPLMLITPDQIDNLLDQLKKDRGIKNNTLNHYLRYISKVFTLAQEAGLVPKRFNPTRTVSGRLKEYRAKTIITASQYEQVAKALLKLKQPDSAGLLLLLLCGLRREELLGLQWENIDFTHNTVTVANTLIVYKNDAGKTVRTLKNGTKNGTVRKVGLPELAKIALQQWYNMSDHSKRWTDKVTGKTYSMVWQTSKGLITQDYFSHVWYKLRDQLLATGVLTQQARLHDLRGGFITYLLNKQHVSPVVVASLAGHKSPKMTLDVYGVTDDNDLMQALNGLNQALK